MSLDLSALSSVTTGATALTGLIVASPQKTIGYQPQNAPSFIKSTGVALPPALVFNYEGEQSITLTADVTDHFIEDNTAVQDQVAIKPNIITTHGFVGELNNIFPGVPTTFNTIESKLVTISAYTPALSVTALEALATAQQLYQVGVNAAAAAVSTYASITGQGGQAVINGSGISNTAPGVVATLTQTQQQKYFLQFYGYFIKRTLWTVQTPWAVFQDMIIQSMHVVQDETTQTVSDFAPTFKQMRFASILSRTQNAYDNTQFDGTLYNQGSDPVNNGVNPLTSASQPYAYG